MPQTLITRLKGILSSRKDDYFEDDDLLDYLNEAYKSVVSTAIKLELEQPELSGRSIRALDKLRVALEVTGVEVAQFREYYTGIVDIDDELPGGAIFLKELYVGGMQDDCSFAMSEIVMARKHKMDFGHLRPTQQRSYYEFINGSNMKIYVPGPSSAEVHIDLIRKPEALVIGSTSLPDLPERLIHGVVLRAAMMAATQEIRQNREDFGQLYQTELSEHLW